MAPAETVVGIIGLVKERMLSRGPVELSGIDNDSSDSRSMTAHPLGQ